MRWTSSYDWTVNERTAREAISRPQSELLWHRLGDPRASDLWLDDNLLHYDQLAASTSRVWGCVDLSYSWGLAVIRDNARRKRWRWGEEKPRWLVRERGYG